MRVHFRQTFNVSDLGSGSNILGLASFCYRVRLNAASFRQITITKFSLTASARPILKAAIIRLLTFEDEIKPPSKIGIH